MIEQIWLSEKQVDSLAPYFPRSRGKLRVDDRRVLSGIIHVQRNRLRRCDAPAICGPHKTLYNRHVRWTRNGVFARIFAALVEAGGPPERIIIDSTHLKAHRTAAGLLQKKGVRGRSGAPKGAELQTARHLRSACAAHRSATVARADERPQRRRSHDRRATACL